MNDPWLDINDWLALVAATYLYLVICFNLRAIGYMIGWVAVRMANWSVR
jgi:hypothetical protein